MATAIKGEVGDDTFDGDAAFAEEIVLIIAFMPRETFVNDVLARETDLLIKLSIALHAKKKGEANMSEELQSMVQISELYGRALGALGRAIRFSAKGAAKGAEG